MHPSIIRIGAQPISNSPEERYDTHPIPVLLRPTLERWLISGVPLEQRGEAVNRIKAFWWTTSPPATSLNLENLRLHDMPSTLRELRGLQTLYVQGTYLRDFSNIFNLHRECEVYITGSMSAQQMAAINATINASGYDGPRIDLSTARVLAQANSRSSVAHHQGLPMHAEVPATAQVPSEPPTEEMPRPNRAKPVIDMDIFKKRKRCDICLLPTRKNEDIALKKTAWVQSKPRVHEQCLIDEFPRQARVVDADLMMASRRWPHTPISMNLIRESLTGEPGINRNKDVYFKIIQRLLDDHGENLQVKDQMQLLLNTAIDLPENTGILIGGNIMTKLDCLIQAMELSIRLRLNSSITLISQHMLTESPRNMRIFSINGVNFPRWEVELWALGLDLPPPHTILRQANEEQVGTNTTTSEEMPPPYSEL